MEPQWLSGQSVRLPCGRYQVRVPAEADTVTFANVGNFLTTSVSAGLSKDKRFHTLNKHDTKTRTTQQHSLQTPYTWELYLDPFPPDVAP